MTIEEKLLAARDAHQNWLEQQPGFNGAGLGLGADGSPCLRIYSNGMSPQTKAAITARIAGVPIDIEETGEFRAQ